MPARDDDALAREAEWISRVAVHDDHEAFAALVRLHEGAVRGFLRRLCAGDWPRADDLAQETFWKAYRHIASYRGQGRFLAWLFGIAWQLHAGGRRRPADLLSCRSPDELVAMADESADPIDLRTLEQLLDCLRPEERAAMILHHLQGMAHPEVSAALGLPLGTVKSLIARAGRKLQRIVAGPIDEAPR